MRDTGVHLLRTSQSGAEAKDQSAPRNSGTREEKKASQVRVRPMSTAGHVCAVDDDDLAWRPVSLGAEHFGKEKVYDNIVKGIMYIARLV